MISFLTKQRYCSIPLLFFSVVVSATSMLKTVSHCGKETPKESGTVRIIFDTDIAGDYDDVGAMALLHAFADQGEVQILATISSNAFKTTVPTISVLNTYFGRPNIPIGVTKREAPKMECQQKWAEAIIGKFPHSIKSNEKAMEAVALYRKILAGEKDNSVTIVTVGFFTNLADLLDSGPDQYSPLTGKELIHKKVKVLVSMASGLDKGKQSGREYNVFIDTPASQKVFSEWNTSFILSPFELGEQVLTGIPLINNSSIKNNPVKDAYYIALTADKNTKGRMSWDQTAVLVAARGIAPYFESRKLNFKIKDDGTNVVIPGDRFVYLSFKEFPDKIAAVIERLMEHLPILK